MGFGLTHIYYGQGVGKTTRAVEMAIRAAGTGLKVDFVQFMKFGPPASLYGQAVCPAGFLHALPETYVYKAEPLTCQPG